MQILSIGPLGAPPTVVDYLVVAGGGSSANGGGGAGGVRSSVTNTGKNGTLESALSVTAGVQLTVTVGAGGAKNATTNLQGTNGANSVFSTITSTVVVLVVHKALPRRV